MRKKILDVCYRKLAERLHCMCVRVCGVGSKPVNEDERLPRH